MAEGDDPEFEAFNPPNTLREKTAGDGPGVDAQALERAEQAIAKLSADYLALVETDIAKLQAALEAFRQEPAAWKQHAEAVFQVSHDIKGQGGSFDYPLMTIIGDSLCRFLERIGCGSPEVLDVIALHVDAMKLVITRRMTGDGGAAGARLLRGLELVSNKVAGP